MAATRGELVVQMTASDLRDLIREAVREELRAAAPEVMTVEQAAAYSGRAPKTIRGWVAEGLPVARKGRRVHIRREDLAAWLARGEATADAVVASLRRPG